MSGNNSPWTKPWELLKRSHRKSFGKRVGKNVFRGTGAEIRNYSDVLEGLMQQFRDQVIIIDAATILADSGKNWLPTHRQTSLTF